MANEKVLVGASPERAVPVESAYTRRSQAMKRIGLAWLAFLCVFWALRSAQAAEPTVLLLLPTTAPEGVALEPLRQAMQKYVAELDPVVQHAPLEGAPFEVRREALRWADSQRARWVVYAAWTGSPPNATLSIWALDTQRAARSDEAFSTKYPTQPDAGFYRSVGLKVRSLLDAAMLDPGAPRSPKPVPPPPPSPQPAAPAAPSIAFGLELFGFGEVPTTLDAITPGIGASVFGSRGMWAVALTGMVALETERATTTSVAKTSSQRMTGTLRARLFEAHPFGMWVGLGPGLIRLDTDATALATGETRGSVYVAPIVDVYALGSLRLAKAWAILAGPQATLFLTRSRVFVQGTEAYTSDFAQWGAGVRVQLSL